MPCQVDDTSIAAALELVERAVADADELLLLRVERDRETRVAAEQAIPPPPPPPPPQRTSRRRTMSLAALRVETHLWNRRRFEFGSHSIWVVSSLVASRGGGIEA